MSKLKKTFHIIRRSYYAFRNKKKLKSGSNVHINGKSKFNNRMQLGNNVHFNGFEVKGGGKVTIGNNFHSGVKVKLITTIHNYNGTHLPYDTTVIHKDVTIGDQVWIGDNVIILGGVTIGEGAIIQAGSVVSSNIEALAIAGGNPARAFKFRDVEHYNTLKNEAKFL